MVFLKYEPLAKRGPKKYGIHNVKVSNGISDHDAEASKVTYIYSIYTR